MVERRVHRKVLQDRVRGAGAGYVRHWDSIDVVDECCYKNFAVVVAVTKMTGTPAHEEVHSESGKGFLA